MCSVRREWRITRVAGPLAAAVAPLDEDIPVEGPVTATGHWRGHPVADQQGGSLEGDQPDGAGMAVADSHRGQEDCMGGRGGDVHMDHVDQGIVCVRIVSP